MFYRGLGGTRDIRYIWDIRYIRTSRDIRENLGDLIETGGWGVVGPLLFNRRCTQIGTDKNQFDIEDLL